MKVPLLDLKAQYASKKEVVIAVGEVLESQVCIGGAKVAELEKLSASPGLNPRMNQIHSVGRNSFNSNQYVIRTEWRRIDRTREKAGPRHRDLSHLPECFGFQGHKEGDFPESAKAAKKVLALPSYPELAHELLEYVASGVLAHQCAST